MIFAPQHECPGASTFELPQFLPLTALYVGRFPSTHHGLLFMWMSGYGQCKSRPKRLVLVASQDAARPQPAALLRRFRWAMRDSPFFAPSSKRVVPLSGVCAFEIDLRDVVGMDYLNPLLVDASRLALEVRQVARRWFPDLAACSEHYGWEVVQGDSGGSAADTPSTAQLLASLYRPTPGANLGGLVALPRIAPSSEFCRGVEDASPHRARYWSERAEERSFMRLNTLILRAERVLQIRHDAKRPRCADTANVASRAVDVQADSNDEVLIMYNQTINFRFDDPFVPYVLREVVHDPEMRHLLRLCEAGLPAWAVYLPMYTGIYRRYMRIVLSWIVLMISFVTLFLGFYDLYRHVPALRRLLKQFLGTWSSRLEELVAVRLGVLLTWMLPYPALFRICCNAAQFLAVCFQHLVDAFSWVFEPLLSCIRMVLWPWLSIAWEPVRVTFVSIGWVFSACRGTLWSITQLLGDLVSGSPAAAVQSTAALMKMEANGLRKAFISIYNSVCFLCVLIAKHQASMRLWLQHRRQRMLEYILATRKRVLLSSLIAFIFFLRDPCVKAVHRARPEQMAILNDAFAGLEFALQNASLSLVIDWACSHAGAMEADAMFGNHMRQLLCRETHNRQRLESPQVNVVEIRLLCGPRSDRGTSKSLRHFSSDGLGNVCWERDSGGRRCQCPFDRFVGVNITWQPYKTASVNSGLILEAPPRRHANGSLTNTRMGCSALTNRGFGSCTINFSALGRFFGGGGTLEFWVLAAHSRYEVEAVHIEDAPAANQVTMRKVTATAAAATFVLEVPRVRATPPQGISLCLDTSTHEITMPRDEDLWWQASELLHCEIKGRFPSHEISEAERVQNVTTSDRPKRLLRATWEAGLLGSCDFVAWEVFIDVGARDRAAPLCSSRRFSRTSCSGWLPPLHGGRPASTLGSPSVFLRCRDPRDSAHSPARMARRKTSSGYSNTTAWQTTVEATAVATAVAAAVVGAILPEKPFDGVPASFFLSIIGVVVCAAMPLRRGAASSEAPPVAQAAGSAVDTSSEGGAPAVRTNVNKRRRCRSKN